RSTGHAGSGSVCARTGATGPETTIMITAARGHRTQPGAFFIEHLAFERTQRGGPTSRPDQGPVHHRLQALLVALEGPAAFEHERLVAPYGQQREQEVGRFLLRPA